MRKIWKILCFEYRQRVWNWRFLLGLLSGPAVMVLIGVFTGARLSALSSIDTNAMGVVDHSGLIAQAEHSLGQVLIVEPLFSYESEDAAREAVDAGSILGYYVLEDTFAQDGAARVVLQKQGGVTSQMQFIGVVQTALLVNAGMNPLAVMRIVDGGSIDYEALPDASGTLPEDNRENSNVTLVMHLANMIIAYVMQFVFFFGITMVNGYVIRILLEERENRTLELLATSTEPRRLLLGKIIANIVVGLTHVVTWIVLGVAGIALLTGSAKFLSYINFVQVGLIALFFLLGTIFVAGVNSTIASLVPKPQLASMLTGLVTLPTMIPFLATQAISDQPGSPLAIVLSVFPVTAMQAMPVRLVLGSPPWWEILISFLLLAGSVWGVLRLAGWAFQLSIRNGGRTTPLPVRFGKRLGVKKSHAQ